MVALSDDEYADSGIKIVKNKRFDAKPMDPEEAVMQMEMLGFNFFVFRNADTDEIDVVYKRNDGNYGLIEPEN
jgi:putative sigma-54 modulation protein